MKTRITTAIAVAIVAVCAVTFTAAQEASPPDPVAVLQDANRLNIEDRKWLYNELGKSVVAEMLQVDPELAARYPGFDTDDQGLCRILERTVHGRSDFPDLRGGGCYWSFSAKSNSYDKTPQIELQQWKFSTGFAGANSGAVTTISAESIKEAGIDDVPEDFTSVASFNYETNKDELRALNRKYRDAKAEVGKVYAVRAVIWDDSDVLAVFEVLKLDDDGCTLAWKILSRYPTPVYRK